VKFRYLRWVILESTTRSRLRFVLALAAVATTAALPACSKPSPPEAPITTLVVGHSPAPGEAAPSPASSSRGGGPGNGPATEVLLPPEVDDADQGDPFGGRRRSPNTAGCPPFDRGAAAAALRAVDVQSCRQGASPRGSGHVKITFATTGAPSSVSVDSPSYAGTTVGGCVALKFGTARIPAFCGAPVTIGKSFTIN